MIKKKPLKRVGLSTDYIEDIEQYRANWKYYIETPEKQRRNKLDALNDGLNIFDLLNKTEIDDDIIDIISYLVDNEIAVIDVKEGRFLYEQARATTGIIVEIGTCRAVSTTLLGLSDIENSSRVYTHDIVQVPSNYQRIQQFGLKCNLIELDSHEAGRSWNKGEIDMLFVDGNHSERYAYGDLDIWSKHLKIGGVICVHDCLRPRQIRRFIKHKRLKNGIVTGTTKNDKIRVHNSVIKFLRNYPLFEEIGLIRTIKILKKRLNEN